MSRMSERGLEGPDCGEPFGETEDGFGPDPRLVKKRPEGAPTLYDELRIDRPAAAKPADLHRAIFDGHTHELAPGRAYVRISGYSLDKVYRPETDADAALLVKDWTTRRDQWGSQSLPYDVLALTVDEVRQLCWDVPAPVLATAAD